MMESLGFNWKPRDKAWDDMFDQLKQYKSLHGDCLVPATHMNSALASWVSQQR